jgi:hypothetical protein
MRSPILLLVALLAAAVGAALIAHAGAATTPPQFRSPDAGAACRLERGALICSSLGSTGSVALHARGSSVVHRLPWWDASTPVLHRFRHGSISCRLSGAAILCRNRSETIRVATDGFAVARQ